MIKPKTVTDYGRLTGNIISGETVPFKGDCMAKLREGGA
jgi:hypothetical protein